MAEAWTAPLDRANASPRRNERRPRGPARPDGVVTRLLTKRIGRLTAEVSEVAFQGGFLVDHTQPRGRVLIALEEVGDRVQARDSPRAPRTAIDTPHRMYVAPAGAPFWTFSEAPLFLRYLSLDYALGEFDDLAETHPLPTSPRFAFFEPRLLVLARRFEAECLAPAPTDRLLADALAVGLLDGLDGGGRGPPRQRYQGGLTPRQSRSSPTIWRAISPKRSTRPTSPAWLASRCRTSTGRSGSQRDGRRMCG